MGRIRGIQASFAGGELSPSLYGRVDLAKFSTGLKRCHNFLVRQQGGVENRPGTCYVDAALGATSRLIPFAYSTSDTYFLEFGEYYLRVIAWDSTAETWGLALRPLSTSAWSWTVSGGGTNEYYLRTAASGDPSIPEPTAFYINDVAATAGTIGSLAAGGWAWGDGDTLGYNTIYVRLSDGTDPDTKADGYVAVPYQTPSPYAAADLPTLKFWQSADTMYLTHPDYSPKTLERGDYDYAWTFSEILFEPAIAPPTGLAAVWSGAAGGGRHIQYKVSAVVDGEESAPSASVDCEVVSPWTAGATVALSWTGVTGAEAYNIYKSSRGFYGWIGTVNESSEGSLYHYYDHDFSTNVTKTTTLTAVTRIVLSLTNRYYPIGGAEQSTITIQWDETGETSWNTSHNAVALHGTHTYAIDFSPITSVAIDVKITVNSGAITLNSMTEVGMGLIYTDDNIDPDISDGPRQLNNPFEDGNDPGCAGVFEQRAVYARSDDDPQTVWLSQTGLLNNFTYSTPLRDTDAIEIAIASLQVNEIRHIVALDRLVLLTSGAEWVLSAPGGDTAISPTALRLQIQGCRGCSHVPPVVVGSDIVFVGRDGASVHALGYSAANDKFNGSSLSVLADHLFRGRTIKEWAYQQRPNSIIWCVMSDGDLLSFTYLPEHEVWAWAEHTTDGTFLSVASVPGDGESDDVCFLVQRTVNSSTVNYLETLAERMPSGVVADSIFLDSSLTYSGAAATTISGLDHLEGETVDALADGGVIKSLTVASGSVTLPATATKVHVGLPMPTPQIEMLPLEVQGAAGRKRRVSRVVLRLEASRGCWVGPDTDHMTEAKWRFDEAYGDATEALTGDKEILTTGKWGLEGTLVIQQRDPLPLTILAVMPEVDVGG